MILDVLNVPDPLVEPAELERNACGLGATPPEYRLPPSVLLAGPKPQHSSFQRLRKTLAQHYRVFVTPEMREVARIALRSAPDAIVIDASGGSTCGFGIFNDLRAHPDTRRIPVLAIASARQKTSGMTVLSAGANDILFRPLAEGELVLRLSQLVALSESQKHLLDAVAQLQATEARLHDSTRRAMEAKLAGTILQDLAQPLARLAQALPEMHGFATSLPAERGVDFRDRLATLQQHLALARGLISDSRLHAGKTGHRERDCFRQGWRSRLSE